jgi:L-threonylcarbamoyladenylate synthase
MITEILGISIESKTQNSESMQVKAPGILDSHYSPKAKICVNGTPTHGDGFIALESFKTPEGVIRLASPKNNEEYARTLYEAFRLADSWNIEKVFVIPPIGNGISVAINDRLAKAAF